MQDNKLKPPKSGDPKMRAQIKPEATVLISSGLNENFPRNSFGRTV